MYHLFVYGSLRRGAEEHSKMAGAVFMGVATTTAQYRLVPIRDFVGLATGAEAVDGELYQATPEKVRELDGWEYGIFTRRVIELADGRLVDAYMVADWALRLLSTRSGVMTIAQRVAARFAGQNKTANWWNTILVRERGDTFEIGVFGEQPASAGWHSLDYMMKEVKGRIRKTADDVVKYLKELGYEVRESKSPTFGSPGGKDNYIGWKLYGRKPTAGDMSLMTDLTHGIKKGVFKAYLKPWQGG